MSTPAPETEPRPFPKGYDEIYFGPGTWAERLERWRTSTSGQKFADGNLEVVEEAISNPESGLRVVVNIGASALIGFLEHGTYKNAYDKPVIGGKQRTPSPERERVDTAWDLDDDTYFAAIALGGTGVRYYGEYCIVLRRDAVDAREPGLADRDSYDILVAPLSELNDGAGPSKDQLDRMRAQWDQLEAMAQLKVLPEVSHDRRLMTTGTISDVVLQDQEFIEVHIPGTFGLTDVEELRVAPDDVSLESRLRAREENWQSLSAVEREWLRKRRFVDDELDNQLVRTRVVSMFGKGYQWK